VTQPSLVVRKFGVTTNSQPKCLDSSTHENIQQAACQLEHHDGNALISKEEFPILMINVTEHN
jgi:hypothetical protein